MKSLFAPAIALVLSANAFAQVPVMRPLFNGKDLSGWTGEGYVVEDGAIVCTPEGRNLVTHGTFASYILDFEFQLTPGANNGLGIHYPGEGDAAHTGLELQILDDGDPKYANIKNVQTHGSIYGISPAKRGALNPAGEWNRQRVTITGPAVHVQLNGQSILRGNLDDLAALHPEHAGLKRRSGHIAFLGHGDRVSFRNIQIAENPPPAHIEGVKAAGYIQLFDGHSLHGWKHDPEKTRNWFATNGVLKHTGEKGDVNDLWTEGSYKDFSLVFDWRWSGRGEKKQQPVVKPDGSEEGTAEVEEHDSGIFLRGETKSQVNLWNWTVGSGEVYGYRTDAEMSPEVRSAVTPTAKADAPVGEWNRMMITLKGDRLTVMLNGQLVIEDAQLPGIPAEGPIGLQHHGQAIDFANIWIKEL